MSAIRRVTTVILCCFSLIACQEDGPDVSESETKFPDILAIERTACERDGGRWAVAIGKSSFVCFQNLSDANKTCASANDCKGLCLARSRSCSPIEPFFGCHEVLSPSGVRQTLCIE